jgi:hypothetical protein
MSRSCQLLISLETRAPFFVLSSAFSRSVGAEAADSPSVELAKRMIFFNVSSSFFHPLDSFSSISSSTDANLLLFLSSRDLAKQLIPSAIDSEDWFWFVWVGGQVWIDAIDVFFMDFVVPVCCFGVGTN